MYFAVSLNNTSLQLTFQKHVRVLSQDGMESRGEGLLTLHQALGGFGPPSGWYALPCGVVVYKPDLI